MARPTDNQRPPGVLVALWLAFMRVLTSLFRFKSPSAPTLPDPVTARSPLKHPHVFHPPAGPFPNISLSAIFASPPEQPVTPMPSPGSSPTPSIRGAHASAVAAPSFHTTHSRSPTPSSAVIVHFDRSTVSPTTMSDGSLEVISLGDRRASAGAPIKVADIGTGRLPSPWSPIGRTASSDVWISVNGTLVNAAGPVDDNPAQTQDDSAAQTTPIFSSLTLSGISTSSLYSSPFALDALGISAFVDLPAIGDHPSREGNILDRTDHPSSSTPKLNTVCDENPATRDAQEPQTPRKRRDTLPSVARPRTPGHSARTTKHLSTPLTRLDSVNISHLRSASSISSMAYEFRLGLFAEGKSMTAIENIISLLDQASPESIPSHNDPMQLLQTV